MAVTSGNTSATATATFANVSASFNYSLANALPQTTFTATANVNSAYAQGAIDGSTGSQWNTNGAQSAGDYIQVNLGSAQTIQHIMLDQGASTGNYPRGFAVEISTDGINWTTVYTAAGSTGSLTDIVLGSPVTAQYVKIVLTASDNFMWWSICEINIFS